MSEVPLLQQRRNEGAWVHSSRPFRGDTLARGYRGTSLIRNRVPLGPYSRTMPRALWWPYEVGGFL